MARLFKSRGLRDLASAVEAPSDPSFGVVLGDDTHSQRNAVPADASFVVFEVALVSHDLLAVGGDGLAEELVHLFEEINIESGFEGSCARLYSSYRGRSVVFPALFEFFLRSFGRQSLGRAGDSEEKGCKQGERQREGAGRRGGHGFSLRVASDTNDGETIIAGEGRGVNVTTFRHRNCLPCFESACAFLRNALWVGRGYAPRSSFFLCFLQKQYSIPR